MTDENTDQPGQRPDGPTDAPGMYDEPDAGISLPLPVGDDEDRIFNPDTDQPERPPLTRPSTAFERPPGNVYVLSDEVVLDPDGPAKFFADLADRSGVPSSDHAPIESVVRLAREAGMETMRIDEDGEAR